MRGFYDYEEIRRLDAKLDGLSSRIAAIEQIVMYQDDILRGIWYLMEEIVSKEKRENWYAELMDKKKK
jgi:hypothetical protein